uniref:Uncharacterized protein n=1 Tax=Chenopodium quinoa TaxID=63459 RepID=A0A803MQP2_CHEQI
MLRTKHRDEEGRVVSEKIELHAHDKDTLKHIEKKLVDTGLHRLERHSADTKASVKKPPPKKGHGDPNYVDEEKVVDDEEVKERVKGEVEVAKVVEGKEGVARVEVDPQLINNTSV